MNVQQGLPLNYRRATNFKNLSPNYGQTTHENPFTNYRKVMNYRKMSVPDHSLRQTVSKEDSTVRTRRVPNIPGNLPQTHSQVRTQNSDMHNTDIKDGYRDNKDDSTLNHITKDDTNLKYVQIFNENLSPNARQKAVSVEERSEQGEVRRFSGPELIKISSEEQELMLLDALHQKTNSSRRGFESSLADMLGKSESIFIVVQ
jgi:hypothetical protein